MSLQISLPRNNDYCSLIVHNHQVDAYIYTLYKTNQASTL